MNTRRHTAGWLRAGRFAGICVLVLGLVTEAAAQRLASVPPTSAQIGITVQVARPLSLETVSHLNFGQVAATLGQNTARVDRDSPDAGRFEVRGSDNVDIRVAYTAPRQLTNESGFGTIGVELELFGAASATNASSAVRLLPNETVALSSGRYYFFVGGELQVGPLSSNPPGIYSGEFELELSYVGL